MNGTFNQSIFTEDKFSQAALYLQVVIVVSFVLAFVLIFTVAIITAVGNCLMLYVVWKEKRLLGASDVLVLNLAFIGLLQTITAMPLSMVYAVFRIRSHEQVCDVREFFSDTLLCASFSALFLISLNRYAVLVCRHNYSSRFSRRRALVYASFTWITALAYAAIMAVYRNSSKSLREYDCSPRSVDNYSPRGAAALKFAFIGFQFIGTLALYLRIIQYFLHRERKYKKGNSSDSLPTKADRKHRAAKKNIRVLSLTIAVLCGGQLLYVVAVIFNLLTGQVSRQVIITALGLYYFCNTAHPVIFGYLNKKFKRAFKRIFRCFFYKVHRWGTMKSGQKGKISMKKMNSIKILNLDKYNSTSINSTSVGEASFSTSEGPLLNTSQASKSLNLTQTTWETDLWKGGMEKSDHQPRSTRSRLGFMNDSFQLVNCSLYEELSRSKVTALFNDQY